MNTINQKTVRILHKAAFTWQEFGTTLNSLDAFNVLFAFKVYQSSEFDLVSYYVSFYKNV